MSSMLRWAVRIRDWHPSTEEWHFLLQLIPTVEQRQVGSPPALASPFCLLYRHHRQGYMLYTHSTTSQDIRGNPLGPQPSTEAPASLHLRTSSVLDTFQLFRQKREACECDWSSGSANITAAVP